MDKRALQSYAIWAKENLEKQIEISLKALGINSDKDIKRARLVGDYTIIDDDFNSYPKDLFDKRNNIINLVKKEGYKNVIEEFAYTWFNRIVALRFMEVHDFLPHGFRVLSSRDGSFEPEILKNLIFVKDVLNLDMNFINNLQDQGKIEELYRYVLFKQCYALSDILPMLFDKDNSYLELLLPKSLLKGETIITKLLEIDESSFLEDVEVIGWLYQFYVSSDRQQFRDAKVVTKDIIPTLTQVFTPDWIVRYMTENSLGRLWLESYPNSSIKNDMRYYVEDAKQESDVQRKLDAIKYKNVNPENIKVIEPCCGSGHILVYIFDLLYKMYDEKGYMARDIPTIILKNNIFGLEIDKRAAQLSLFSLIMKARKANNRFFNSNYFVKPNVIEILDSEYLIDSNYKKELQELRIFSNEEIKATSELVETFRYAKTIGSLLIMPKINISLVEAVIDKLENRVVRNIFNIDFINESSKLLRNLIRQYKIMSSKYDVMITNPPYLGISKMESAPKQYLIDRYPNSKSDMFAMFMEAPYCKKNGFIAMVNPDSWMFLVSFEALRKSIIMNQSIVNMIHLGMGAFDATVQTTSFVIRNADIAGNGVYFRLVDEKDKESAFLNGGGLIASLESFKSIPSNIFAYWLSEQIKNIFANSIRLDSVAEPKQGLATSDNNRFLRLWYEVDINNLYFSATDYINAMYTGKKWFPYNKGGKFRRWYGNNEYVVNYYENGKDLSKYDGAILRNTSYYFRESITWSKISSGKIAFRYKPKGHIFDVAGTSIFNDNYDTFNYLLGLLNTNFVQYVLGALSATLNYEVGQIASLPIIINEKKKKNVIDLVKSNINLSKNDWDEFEASWDFKKHPLI